MGFPLVRDFFLYVVGRVGVPSIRDFPLLRDFPLCREAGARGPPPPLTADERRRGCTVRARATSRPRGVWLYCRGRCCGTVRPATRPRRGPRPKAPVPARGAEGVGAGRQLARCASERCAGKKRQWVLALSRPSGGPYRRERPSAPRCSLGPPSDGRRSRGNFLRGSQGNGGRK